MTTSDRTVLVRCTILLSAMAWFIPGGVLLMVYSLLNEMAPVLAESVGDMPLGDITIQMSLSSVQQGHGLSTFALAFGMFAVFAIGMILASISLWTGRQAIRLGATDITLLAAITGSLIYLGGLTMMLLNSII